MYYDPRGGPNSEVLRCFAYGPGWSSGVTLSVLRCYLAWKGSAAQSALLFIRSPQEAVRAGVEDLKQMLQRKHDFQQPHARAQ